MARVRMQDANGDAQFGQSAANFFVNDVEGIAQNIKTRLLLMQGEWFLDNSVGTPYSTAILGKNTAGTRDQAVKSVILGTTGVTGIINYSSELKNRKFTVTCTVNTIYGPVTVITPLTVTQ